MKKIKILFIIPALTGGGAERILGYLSKKLSEDKNYEIYVVIFEDKVIYEYGGNLIKLKKMIASKNTIFKIINRLFYICQLRKIKKMKKINISVSFLEISDIFNFFSSNKKEVLVTSVRNNPSIEYETIINSCKYKFLGTIYVKIHQNILKYFDKIIAISKGVEYELKKNELIAKKVETINNFIKKDYIEKKLLETSKTQRGENKLILTAGRLENQKCHWELIKSFKLLCEERDNVELHILGQGTLKEKLEKFTLELGISQKVKFLGFQNNPYIHIKKCDIFVFTSNYEGLGNILLEVGFLEKCIISTDCLYGPREILTELLYSENIKYPFFGKNGILIENFNSKTFNSKINKKNYVLATLLKELLDRDKERNKMGLTLKEKINKEYSEEVIVEKWKHLFYELSERSE